jgi:hypothetical protein
MVGKKAVAELKPPAASKKIYAPKLCAFVRIPDLPVDCQVVLPLCGQKIPVDTVKKLYSEDPGRQVDVKKAG